MAPTETSSATTAPTDTGVPAQERIDRLERKLARARQEVKLLETMIEDKTRSLYLAQAELRDSKVYLENVLQSMQSAVIIVDQDGSIASVGGTTTTLTGRTEGQLVGAPVSSVIAHDRPPGSAETIVACCGRATEAGLIAGDGSTLPVLVTTSILHNDAGDGIGVVLVATDLSERKQLEVELRHAQRLESIGQLAAGVAHEINTPIQFIGDSVRFLSDVFHDLMGLTDGYQALKPLAAATEEGRELVGRVEDAEDEVDLDFVRDEGPKAVSRTVGGIERVAEIIRALKQFSHPGEDEMAPADVNQIIETTLTVARSEYKYVADVEVELGPLPEVVCHRGDLGQVFINLVVNAAHAIADRAADTSTRGTIRIGTRAVDDGVIIEIADTGGGIPAEIRDRVFEPFFTTKEPGRGTGQGLALAHNVVVGKHNGRIGLDVDDGVGTTFTLWLPLRQEA